MQSFVATLTDRWQKHMVYRQTVRAIQNMPLGVALDLDICRDDAPRIARRVVYGV